MKYIAKNKIDNNVLIRGDSCITTLQELYVALSDPECTEIEITKEFIAENFTYPALCEFVENSSTIAPNIQITVDDSTVGDISALVKELQTIRDPEEFIYALTCNPTKIMQTLHELYRYYLSVHEDVVQASNKQAVMVTQMDELKAQLKQKDNMYADLLKVLNESNSRLQTLVNRVNFSYEKTIEPDKLFVVDSNKFDHVLYLKEITRVHYTDTLVYYLQEILKTLYSMPTRVVVIEPYYAYSRYSLYKDKGFAPHWDLSYRDVYSGNIFMAGCQPNTLRDIMQNSNHLRFIIVLDRAGYITPHVTGNNVTVVYTASDKADIPEGVDADKVITYEADTLNIPYVPDFNSLSLEKKIQKYSSMPIIQKMINILEGDV